MTLKIKTFKASHAVDLTLSPFQAETMGALDYRYGALLETNCRIAQTLCLHNRALACWGLLPLWTGVSEAWMLVTPDIKKGSKLVVRALEAILEDATEHRVQTSVLEGFKTGQKFVEFLGFKPEGVMSQYDVLGRNHIRYARIYNG